MKNWVLVVLFCFMFLLIMVQECQMSSLLNKGIKQEAQLLETNKQVAELYGVILVDELKIQKCKQAIDALAQEDAAIRMGIQEEDYLMETLTQSIKEYMEIKK